MPHHTADQPRDCDSLDACAGYTETRWTSLEGCGWEESFSTVQNLPVYEQEVFLEQPIRAIGHVSTRDIVNDEPEVEQASFLVADDQIESDPSLNEEVLEYTESLLLSTEQPELESEDARYEKQLDEISVEYLQ